MANEVDERIVAAKFDATEFEKGVDKTVKKLDELKKSLQIKDGSKSITDLAEKTEKASQDASKSLEKLTDRFTNFTGMIKQKLLSGLADQVVGVFFKMQSSIHGLINTLTSQQFNAGMGKYEQMLTSVRTMVSAGVGQEKAYQNIERLAAYSDQTSYSLEQMTDAMSKMVAAGVNVDEAAKSVEGIANACAVAGVNAQDASRAYYNLSQAYSSGVLKYTDYRSLELLNMTTAEFKNQMLEAAVAAGTLTKKVDKLGKTTYTTTNKKDKKVTSGKKVTTENLSDSLRYNFINKEAMNQLFGGTYYMDVIDPEEIKKQMVRLAEKQFLEDGHTQEELDRLRTQKGEREYQKTMQEMGVQPFIRTYGELAYKAYMAAKEARSLTDVFNTLKDVISTGWSTSFEYIFGKLDEATEFFTWLTESDLANAIYSIGEWRNEVLGAWAQNDASAEGKSGRDYMIEALQNIDSILGKVTEAMGKFAPDAKTLGFTLARLSKQFAEATARFNEWLTTQQEGEDTTPLQRFTNAIRIVSEVVGIAGYAISTAYNLVKPVLNGLFKALDTLIRPLSTLGAAADDKNSPFNKLRESIDNMYIVLKPVADVLGKVLGFLGDIGAFFLSMSIDTAAMNISFFADALGLLIELLGGESAQEANDHGVMAGIAADINGLKDACTGAITAVGDFFKALIGDLRQLLGISEKVEGETEENQNGGFFSRIINFFNTNQFLKDADAWVQQASTDVKQWIADLPTKVGNFFNKIQEAISGLFVSHKTMEMSDGTRVEWDAKSDLAVNLEIWFGGLKKTFLDFIASIPERLGNIANMLYEAIYGIFFQEKTFETADGKKYTYTVDTTLTTWLKNLNTSIKKWIKKLPKFSLSDIFKKIFYEKKSAVVDGQKREWEGRTGIGMLMDRIFGTVRAEEMRKKLLEFADTLQQAASNIKNTIVSIWNRVGETIKNGNLKELLTGVINDLKNLLISFFSGSTDNEYNTKWLGNKVAEAIAWIDTKAKEVWPTVIDFITSIPQKISNIFTGEGSEGKEATATESAIKGFAETVGGFIASIPGTLVTFVDNAIKEISKLWNRIYSSLTGNDEDQAAEEIEKSLPRNYLKREVPKQKSKWEEFVEELGKSIVDAFSKLPGWIVTGLNMALQGVSAILERVKIPVSSAAAEGVGKAVEEGATETKEQSELQKSLLALGETIKKLIMETIPAKLSEGFNWVGTKAAGWWDSVKTIFNGWLDAEGEHADLKKNIANIGLNIMGWLETIPGYIRRGFRFVQRALQGKQDYGFFNPIMDRVDDAYKEIKDKVGGPTESNDALGINDLFVSIGEKIQNAFGLILPYIIEGWNNTLSSIQQFLGYAGDILSGKKSVGDALADVFGEENAKKIEEAINKFGETIKNFITTTLPTFISTAFQTIVTEGPRLLQEFFDNLMGSFTPKEGDVDKTAETLATHAKKNVGQFKKTLDLELKKVTGEFTGDGASKSFGKETAGAQDILSTTMDGINNIFGYITSNEFLQQTPKYAAFLMLGVTLIKVIEMIKDLVSSVDVAGSMAEKAAAKNSIEAVFKRLLTALIAAMALVAYAANLDDKQFEKATTMLDKLSNLFIVISGIFGGASVIKSISDAISSFGEAKEAVNSFGGAVKTMAGGAAGAVAVEAIGGSITDVIQEFIGTFEELGVGIGTFAAAINNHMKDIEAVVDNVDIIWSMFTDITRIMGKVQEISGYKSNVNDLNEMSNTLGTSLGFFAYMLGRGSGAKQAAEGVEKMLGLTDEMQTFVEFTEKDDTFDRFKYAMSTLGNALSFQKGDGVFDETAVDAAKTFLTKIVSDEGILGLANQLNTETFSTDTKDMWAASERLIMFAGVLASLGDAVQGFSAEKGTAVQEFFNAIEGMTLSTSIDVKDANSFASKLFALGSGLQSFSGSITGIDKTDVETAEYALNMLTAIGERASKFGSAWLGKIFGGSTDLTELGSQIELIGINVSGFFNEIKIKEGEATATYEDIQKAIMVIQSVASAAVKVKNTDGSNLGKVFDNLGSLAERIVTFMVSMSKTASEVNGTSYTIDSVSFEPIEKAMEILDKLAVITARLQGVNINRILVDFGDMISEDIGATTKETLGQKIARFYESLQTNLVDKNYDISTILKAIDGIKTIGDTLANMFSYASYGRTEMIEGDRAMGEILDAMDAMIGRKATVDALFGAFNDLSGYNLDGVNKIFGAIKLMGDALSTFGTVNHSSLNVNDFYNPVLEGIDHLTALDPAVIKGAIMPLIQGLIDFSNNQENLQELLSVGSNIALTIAQGIQAAFDDPANNDVKIRVTPILEMGDIQKQLQDSGLTGYANGTFTGLKVTLPEDFYEQIKIPDYSSRLDTINSNIETLNTSIGTLGDDMAKMKLYLDGRLLVGGIINDVQAELNERDFYYVRGLGK